MVRLLNVAPASLNSFPFGPWFTHTVAETQALYFHSGDTKTRAAAACQYAIDHWRPDLLINLGTCGGVAEDIQPREVVLAEKTVQYDCIDRMQADGEPFLRKMITRIDCSWLDAPLPDVRRGVIGTADQDLCEESAQRLRQHGVLAVDWESGAIAKICELNGVRCVILRGVTDLDASYEDYCANTPLVMEALLKRAVDIVRCVPWS